MEPLWPAHLGSAPGPHRSQHRTQSSSSDGGGGWGGVGDSPGQSSPSESFFLSFLPGAVAGCGVPGPANAGHHGADDTGGSQKLSQVSEARNGGQF